MTKEKLKLQRQSQALLHKFSHQLTVDDLREITEENDVNGDVADTSGGLSTDQKHLLKKIEGLC